MEALNVTLYAVVSWLATYAIHSTVLLGTAWGVTRYFLADNPAARDIIWKTAAMGGLLSATLVLLALPGPGALLSEHLMAGRTETVDHVANHVADPVHSSNSNHAIFSGASGHSFSYSVSSDAVHVQRFEPVAPVTAWGTHDEIASAAGASGSADIRLFLANNTTTLLFALWILVGGALIIRLERRRARFIEGLGRRRGILAGAMYTQLRSLSDACEVDHVELTTARGIASPAVLTASEICVPREALTELEENEQRSLVTHEFAHVIRRDPYWLRAMHILERVFFFQPLNRVARIEFEHAAEELCDNWTVERTGQADSLASCLVRVARWVRGEPDLGFASIAGRPLRNRIERLISGREASSGRAHFYAVGSVLALVLAIAAWGPVLSVDELPASQASVSSLFHQLADVPAPPAPPAPPSPPSPPQAPNPLPPQMVYSFAVNVNPPDTVMIRFGRNDRFEFSNDGDEVSAKGFADGFDRLRVTGFGTVTLRESGSISSISEGGYFAIESESAGRTRKATARATAPDAIAYEYTEDGRSSAFEAADQAWFNDATEYFVERMHELRPRQTDVVAQVRELEVVREQLARQQHEVLANLEAARVVSSVEQRKAIELANAQLKDVRVQTEAALVQARMAAEQAAAIASEVDMAAVRSAVAEAEEAVAARALIESQSVRSNQMVHELQSMTQRYESQIAESRRQIEELQVRIRQLERELEKRLKTEN